MFIGVWSPTIPLGKPFTSTLLTSTFVFRSGGFPFRRFEVPFETLGLHN